jgi:hypothetical protein
MTQRDCCVPRPLQFDSFTDDRGYLVPIEFSWDDLPFIPARVFVISGVPPDATRANHASNCDEILVCGTGDMVVVMDTAEATLTVHLDRPGAGVFVPSGVWVSIRDFSAGAALLVLASKSHAATLQLDDHARYLERKRSGEPLW